MPKAYLRQATLEAIAKEAAYHEYPAASESGLGGDDIGWINAYKAARAELVDQYGDGIGLQPGGYPGVGIIGLKSGLVFACDGRDWYVDNTAVAIEKVDAGALRILGNGRQ